MQYSFLLLNDIFQVLTNVPRKLTTAIRTLYVLIQRMDSLVIVEVVSQEMGKPVKVS